MWMRLGDLPRSCVQAGQEPGSFHMSPTLKGSMPGNNQDVGRLNNWKFQSRKNTFPPNVYEFDGPSWLSLALMRTLWSVMRLLKNPRTSIAAWPGPLPQVSEEVMAQRGMPPRLLEEVHNCFQKAMAFGRILSSLQSWHQACLHLPALFPRQPHFLLQPGACWEGVWAPCGPYRARSLPDGTCSHEHQRQAVRTPFSDLRRVSCWISQQPRPVSTAALQITFRIPATRPPPGESGRGHSEGAGPRSLWCHPQPSAPCVPIRREFWNNKHASFSVC